MEGAESDVGTPPDGAVPGIVLRMDERDYQEIIARSEDPNETFDDIKSRPAGPETWEWVREAARRLFDHKSTLAKIRRIPELPLDLAVERIARPTPDERAVILSSLPEDLRSAIRLECPRKRLERET